MKKILNKVLSITLICIIAITPVSHTLAASNNMEVQAITKSTNDLTIAECSDDTYKYVCTNNKITNTVKMEQYLLSTGELIKTVDSDNFNDMITITDEKTGIKTLKADSKRIYLASTSKNQNTFSNYEYTKTYGAPNVWELRRPDGTGSLNGTYYFNTKETSANKDFLEKFYDDVEEINTLEGKIITACGFQTFLAGVMVALCFVTSGMGAPLAAYLASVTAGSGGVALALECGKYCSDAEDKYYSVMNCSSIFY